MGAGIILKGKKVVLFDSTCLLCNRTIQLLLNIDTKNKLSFTSLSSDLGKSILSDFAIETDSVLFYNQGKISKKSRAIFNICNQLSFPYSALTVFRFIPLVITDWVYDFIATHRISWFGQTSNCLVASKDISGRIIH